MSTHYYAGSCIELCNAGGYSTQKLPYSDAAVFVKAVEQWEPVSVGEFTAACGVTHALQQLVASSGLLKDRQHNVYIMYHIETDTHYFFVAAC